MKLDNVADPEQIKKQEQKERDLRKQQLNDIRTVLSNVSGRRLIWRLLERCQTFGSVFSPEHATMAYTSGQQDLGHFIMAEITMADENLLFKLMKENKRVNDE